MNEISVKCNSIDSPKDSAVIPVSGLGIISG